MHEGENISGRRTIGGLHHYSKGFLVMSGRKNHRGWGWIRKRASGRYQASYIGPDHARHHAPTTFHHKVDAEEWLTAERREIQIADAAVRSADVNQGSAGLQWVSHTQRQAAVYKSLKSEVTLTEYATDWIRQRPLKPRTRIHYSRIWKSHIGPELGSISIGNLRPARVRAWYATALAEKPTLRRHAYQLLHATCADAVGDELLSRNPCTIKGATSVENTRGQEHARPGGADHRRIGDHRRHDPPEIESLRVDFGMVGFALR